MSEVLVLTLGPIQDFILAARRCRDLWFGSWLLSELSKAAARGTAETAQLVFPGAEGGELAAASDTSVANKIVAVVPDGVAAADVARNARRRLDERLQKVRELAFEKINARGFRADVAQMQIDDLIECQWASAPVGAAGYAGARRAAEELLGARKNTRLWGPVPWGAPVPKSSIDGERESVLDETVYDDLKDRPQELRKLYGLGASERLCGVGLLKRHGTRDDKKMRRYSHHFLSTGHLAAWPLLERMERLPPAEQETLRALWSRFTSVLAERDVVLQDLYGYSETEKHPVLGRFDGGLLYENRLPDLFEDNPDAAWRKESVRLARKALTPFLKALGQETPLPYYAILAADGDHMGKAIQRQTDVAGHQALSRALDLFARQAAETVEKHHRGELIYAGGDDVLAFVPLHRVLSCAQALAADFRKHLEGFPAGDSGATPTLSVGIGISHFLDPMGRALALARRAESCAKEPRNALAVFLDKRSGPPIESRGLWGTIDRDLHDFTVLHCKDWVPDGAAYELRDLARLLTPQPDDVAVLERLVRAEAIRILKRKQPQHGDEATLAEGTLERLVAVLDREGIGALSDRLLIGRILAEATVASGIPIAADIPLEGNPQ